MARNPIRIFGEVLFDQFPDGYRVLGGAPFNVAWHLQAFGQKPDFISRIGDDADGRQIQQAMSAWGMSLENLQVDLIHATGKVQITLQNGEPEYDIVANQAYDFIDAALLLGSPLSEGILYHGTLALRHPVSLTTFNRLAGIHQGKILVDINLRSPWWQPELVKALLYQAHWAKLNSDELLQLQPIETTFKDAIRTLAQTYQLELLIVTEGERGAVALDDSGRFFEVRPSQMLSVVDTVGAGDAFTAVVLLGLQLNWPLPVILERAQDFASALVGRQGAIVQDLGFYQAFTHSWQLDYSD
jgi:fructokinase